MFNVSVNFKIQGGTPHFGKHIRRFNLFFDELYVIYQLSKIKDDIQVVSQFPYFLGHLVPITMFLINVLHIVILTLNIITYPLTFNVEKT